MVKILQLSGHQEKIIAPKKRKLFEKNTVERHSNYKKQYRPTYHTFRCTRPQKRVKILNSEKTQMYAVCKGIKGITITAEFH